MVTKDIIYIPKFVDIIIRGKIYRFKAPITLDAFTLLYLMSLIRNPS